MREDSTETTVGAKYSAVSCTVSPGAPTAMRHRVTPRYFPISDAVLARTSRGVDWRYISRLISAIAARSRCVSAGEGGATAGAAGAGGGAASASAGRAATGAGAAGLRGAPFGHQLARS